MSSSSSSNGALEVALLNGNASANPDVIASFRVGDNSMDPDGMPEFMLSDRTGLGSTPVGHLTWDAAYEGASGGDFFSVAPVRLRMDAEQICWSVGTADFIARPSAPFRRISKIQVLAVAAGEVLEALVRWDLLHVKFRQADGSGQSHASPCLPRASSQIEVRRAISGGGGGGGTSAGIRQQYAEIVGPRGAVGLELKGQVTLQARGGVGRITPLPADGLQGKVLIFTE
jgi:hypothetical protein